MHSGANRAGWSGIGSIVCRYVVQKQGSGCTRKWRFVLFQLLGSIPPLPSARSLSNDEENPSVLATRVVSYANVPESIPVSDYDGLNDSFESFKLVIGFHYLVSKVYHCYMRENLMKICLCSFEKIWLDLECNIVIFFLPLIDKQLLRIFWLILLVD